MSLGGFALCAVGATGFAAAVYYLHARGDEKLSSKKTAQHTPEDEDPVQCSGRTNRQKDTSNPEECDHEHEALRVIWLMYKDVKEIVKQIEELRKECEQERQAHSLLTMKYEDMKELVKQNDELRKECEFKQQAHKLLKEKYVDIMGQNEETIKDCEQERQAHRLLKRKYDEMIEAIKHNQSTLERENASLEEQIKTLQDSQEKLEKQLDESRTMWEEISNECEQERQAHRLLKAKYDEMMNVIKHNDRVLKSTLEHENPSLKEKVKTLWDSQENLEKQLDESQRMCEEILSQSPNYLNFHGSLAKAEKISQEAPESSTLLTQVNSNLMDQIQSSLEKLKPELFGTSSETSHAFTVEEKENRSVGCSAAE